MDFSFHLQQGNKLLEKQDADSVKKGIEHFIKANQVTGDGDIAKPQTLYHVAYANLLLGNIEQAYKVAFKAKRAIAVSRRHSIISMTKWPGEDNIQELIDYIEANFPFAIVFTDTSGENINENEIDFSNLHTLYKTNRKASTLPEFRLEDCSEDLLIASFFGMGRNEEDLLYFDKKKGDVLHYVEGYLTSHLGDQSIVNRRLYNRIMSNEPFDEVDEDRHILFPRLLLSDFLKEYKQQTRGREPFYSFTDQFASEIVEEYSDYGSASIEEICANSHILEKFEQSFVNRYGSRLQELKEDYGRFFNSTCRALAYNWIKSEIFQEGSASTSVEADNLNFEFRSSDHLRYENGVHVSGPHGGARRLVKVEPNIEGGQGYTVTLFNLDGNHPLWQNNVQMAPKQMRVIKQEGNMTELRGFGYDQMGGSFADYGLTVYFKGAKVDKCVLHMHDRGVDIEYLS